MTRLNTIRWASAVLLGANLLVPPVWSAENTIVQHGPPAVEGDRQSYASTPLPSWGSAENVYSIGACAFQHTGSGFIGAMAPSCSRVEPTTGQSQFSASIGFPVNLPTGALITSVKMNFFDNHLQSPYATFLRWSSTGVPEVIADLNPGVFDGGNGSVTVPASHTVANAGGSYSISAYINRTTAGFDAIYGFEISYRLQVSPAPAAATFPNDVPTTHPFFRFIEAMAAAGLTNGCAPQSFCPEAPLTRGQAAAFLAKALGLHFPN